MIVQILSVDGYTQDVFLLLERGESASDLGLLVGHQEGLLWLKENLSAVLFRDFPLILQRDSRVVLD